MTETYYNLDGENKYYISIFAGMGYYSRNNWSFLVILYINYKQRNLHSLKHLKKFYYVKTKPS